jgi:hypothetical protein
MKNYLTLTIIVIIIASCNSKKESTIRKIPCENSFTYNNAGTLNGTYLTLYYAVDYSDSIPIKKIRYAVDSIFKNIETKNYSGFVCWFLKESDELEKIKNCEITDSHNVSSSEHKALVLFMYDTQRKELQEINYDKSGNFISQPFRR